MRVLKRNLYILRIRSMAVFPYKKAVNASFNPISFSYSYGHLLHGL